MVHGRNQVEQLDGDLCEGGEGGRGGGVRGAGQMGRNVVIIVVRLYRYIQCNYIQ